MELKEGYKHTEVGVIPEDWEVKTAGEICLKIQDGTHFSPSIGGNDYFYITSKNVGHGIFNLSNAERIDTSQHKAIFSRCDVRKGDVLLTKDGANTGNAALNHLDEEFSLLSSVAFMRFDNQKHEPGYYLQQILSSDGHKRIKELMVGNAITRLTLDKIRKLKFPIPPTLAEQTTIVNALFDADALIRSMEKLIVKKCSIKQGVMQELLRSKEGWVVKKLGEVAEIKDGTHQTPKYVDAGVPFYSVENVTRRDFINTKFISEEEHSILTKAFRIEKGDVLMTRIGSIGDCKFVDWEVSASFYVSLALLKIKNGFFALYLSFYSNSAFFKKEIELNSLQSAIPKKINLGQISNVRVEIPESYEEQTRIATILSDMDAEIAALETKLAKYKQVKQGMMQNLLTGRIRLI